MLPAQQFDPVVAAIDWLDACKSRDLDDVIDFYAEDATLECACCDTVIFTDRSELQAYWQPKLADPSPKLFELERVWDDPVETSLAYRSHDRKLIRVSFSFDEFGKIVRSRCTPIDCLAKSETPDVRPAQKLSPF